METSPTDTRCPICYGLWSPFPCPYDRAQGDKEQLRQEMTE
jgi:hypothetical protein